MAYNYTGDAGGHMWNAVKMDDNNWYNFDATFDHSVMSQEYEPEYMFRTDRSLRHDYVGKRSHISGPKCKTNFRIKNIANRIKEWIKNPNNSKKALPPAIHQTIKEGTSMQNSWNLDNYGISKEEYNERVKDINKAKEHNRSILQKEQR